MYAKIARIEKTLILLQIQFSQFIEIITCIICAWHNKIINVNNIILILGNAYQ